MGTESTTSSLRGHVASDVGDVKLLDIQALGNGIGLGVGDEIQDELDGILGPSTERARSADVLGLNRDGRVRKLENSIENRYRDTYLGVTTATTLKGVERDGFLLEENVVKVGLGASESLSIHSVSDLNSVLEMNAEVVTASLGS